ncbi:MAG: hypothetical protein ABI688_05390 [Bacteroidota bacterium]
MKKIILMCVIVISGSLITKVSAQVRVSINIGSQPTWGPTGYDHVDYYYMPDMDMYYYVPKHQYIYMQGGQWRFSSVLPRRYSNFDFNTGYKVVVNEPRPYNRAAYYRTKYASYKGNHDQQIIRNSHEEKYWQIKDHPDHDKWKNNHNKNNNNGHH